MNRKTTSIAALIATLLVIAATTAMTTVAGAGPDWSEIGNGPDFTYGSPNPFADAEVTVAARAIGNGEVQVRLDATGVDAAGQRFGAHVHQKPCGPLGSDAGGHYLSTDASGSLRHQEIWLDFTVDDHGTGGSIATRNWSLAGARSVVIHAQTTANDGTAGARLACIDVSFDGI